MKHKNNIQVKQIEGSQYMGVAKCERTWNGRKAIRFRAVANRKHIGYFDTEKEAAIAVDKALIKSGRTPINVLKPKQQGE